MIRPSMLPKLAECSAFQSSGKSSPAAARGTKLDTAFRDLLSGDPKSNGDLLAEDISAIQWAVRQVELICGTAETREEDCKIRIPGFVNPGTCDAVNRSKRVIFDLKTGAIRNYREQMAAYALGLMEECFCESWTCYVLFCDQREITEYAFTYSEAKELVERVIASAANPTPTDCEYCGWCALKDQCPVPVKKENAALHFVKATAADESVIDAILQDSVRLSEALVLCSTFDKLRDRLKERAVEILTFNPSGLQGWKLRKGMEREVVDPNVVESLLPRLGTKAVMDAYGPMSAKRFKELWESKTLDPIPTNAIRKEPPTKPSLVKA